MVAESVQVRVCMSGRVRPIERAALASTADSSHLRTGTCQHIPSRQTVDRASTGEARQSRQLALNVGESSCLANLVAVLLDSINHSLPQVGINVLRSLVGKRLDASRSVVCEKQGTKQRTPKQGWRCRQSEWRASPPAPPPLARARHRTLAHYRGLGLWTTRRRCTSRSNPARGAH